MAGSQLVTARGFYETDILFQEKLNIHHILKFYNYDYVVLEGVSDGSFPKIIAASSEEEVLERLDENTFAISGRLANKLNDFKGLPVINAIEDVEKLVDLIEEKVEDYTFETYSIRLKNGKKDIKMVPFVQKALKNTILGFIKELKGFEEGENIKIEILPNYSKKNR